MDKLDLKNPAIQKVAISAVLAVAVLGVFFFSHFLPFGYPASQEKLASLKSDYEQKSTELARARATVSDLPRFEAEYDKLHDRWVKAAELLPTDHQVPVLLRKITLAAQQTGVEFVVFRPSEARTQDHYTELPLAVSVYGGYHQVGSFIAELANGSVGYVPTKLAYSQGNYEVISARVAEGGGEKLVAEAAKQLRNRFR